MPSPHWNSTPGDELTVIDTEGRQRGELTVLARGSEDYAPLDATPDTVASVLRGLPPVARLPGLSGTAGWGRCSPERT